MNGRFARARCGLTPRLVLNASVARRVSNHFKCSVWPRRVPAGVRGQPFSKPQEVSSVGTWRGGVCPRGFGVRSKRLSVSITAVQPRRGSVLGTPSMTARRQPQAHSACPTGGERVDTVRCVDCRSVAIDSFVDRQGTGIPPLVAGGGEAKEDPGTRSRLCCYRSCPRVCSISRTGSNSTVAIGSGSESPPKFDEQLVSIKRRVAVNICLGRYPVVARRCLGSYTPRLAELQVEGGNVGLNVGSAGLHTAILD